MSTERTDADPLFEERSETPGAPGGAESSARRRIPLAQRPWFTFLATLLAVVIGGALSLLGTRMTLEQQAQQLERTIQEQRATETRDLRRPVYLAFSDAANTYATTQALRSRECKKGTDEPLRPGGRCTLTLLGDLQQARFNFQGAINAMGGVETPEAGAAVRAVLANLPTSLVGVAGNPVEGAVDQTGLTEAFVEFIRRTKCDTSPAPPPGC